MAALHSPPPTESSIHAIAQRLAAMVNPLITSTKSALIKKRSVALLATSKTHSLC
jgi:hypothetical protein